MRIGRGEENNKRDEKEELRRRNQEEGETKKKEKSKRKRKVKIKIRWKEGITKGINGDGESNRNTEKGRR